MHAGLTVQVLESLKGDIVSVKHFSNVLLNEIFVIIKTLVSLEQIYKYLLTTVYNCRELKLNSQCQHWGCTSVCFSL